MTRQDCMQLLYKAADCNDLSMVIDKGWSSGDAMGLTMSAMVAYVFLSTLFYRVPILRRAVMRVLMFFAACLCAIHHKLFPEDYRK